jgi:hypothetical protein
MALTDRGDANTARIYPGTWRGVDQWMRGL